MFCFVLFCCLNIDYTIFKLHKVLFIPWPKHGKHVFCHVFCSEIFCLNPFQQKMSRREVTDSFEKIYWKISIQYAVVTYFNKRVKSLIKVKSVFSKLHSTYRNREKCPNTFQLFIALFTLKCDTHKHFIGLIFLSPSNAWGWLSTVCFD